MLKKEKQRADKVSDQQKTDFPNTLDSLSTGERRSTPTTTQVSSERDMQGGKLTNGYNRATTSSSNDIAAKTDNRIKDNLQKIYQRADSSTMSIGRKEAFDIFRRDYKDSEIVEENKRGLKARYADAKRLGEEVNQSRLAINNVKSKLEKLKAVHLLQAADGSTNAEDRLREERVLRDSLDAEKARYKEAFNRLKLLKTEIEHIQHLLERLKMKMQKDFEIWWIEEANRMHNRMLANGGGGGGGGGGVGGGGSSEVKTAWKTPPVTPHTTSTNKPTESSRPSSRSASLIPTRTEDEKLNTFGNKSQKSLHSVERGDSVRKDTLVSSSFSSIGSRPASSGIRLTGDQKTDEDILAFMKAREELMRKTKR